MGSTVFVRSEFNYDMMKASDASGLSCAGDPGVTKQSFVEECDINTIVRRFLKTGELPDPVRMPTYGDFTSVFDFHSAMNAVAQARESFEELPAEVRARFHNDPGEFVDFCSKEENLEEARKIGLVPASEIVEKPSGAAQGAPGAVDAAAAAPGAADAAAASHKA